MCTPLEALFTHWESITFSCLAELLTTPTPINTVKYIVCVFISKGWILFLGLQYLEVVGNIFHKLMYSIVFVCIYVCVCVCVCVWVYVCVSMVHEVINGCQYSCIGVWKQTVEGVVENYIFTPFHSLGSPPFSQI